MSAEPLRRCLSCGFLAYRFTPCRTCRAIWLHRAMEQVRRGA